MHPEQRTALLHNGSNCRGIWKQITRLSALFIDLTWPECYECLLKLITGKL